jgi:hypothetical protein
MIPIIMRRMLVEKTRISVYLLKTKGMKCFSNYVLMTSFLGGFTFLTSLQNMISALPYWILLPSSVNAAMKRVIYKKKSITTAIPATRQKEYRAGTSVSIPMKNASASQNAAVNIEGPISFKA